MRSTTRLLPGIWLLSAVLVLTSALPHPRSALAEEDYGTEAMKATEAGHYSEAI